MILRTQQINAQTTNIDKYLIQKNRLAEARRQG